MHRDVPLYSFKDLMHRLTSQQYAVLKIGPDYKFMLSIHRDYGRQRKTE